MLEKGCLNGQRVWKRVLKAIKEIQRQEPREGEKVAGFSNVRPDKLLI